MFFLKSRTLNGILILLIILAVTCIFLYFSSRIKVIHNFKTLNRKFCFIIQATVLLIVTGVSLEPIDIYGIPQLPRLQFMVDTASLAELEFKRDIVDISGLYYKLPEPQYKNMNAPSSGYKERIVKMETPQEGVNIFWSFYRFENGEFAKKSFDELKEAFGATTYIEGKIEYYSPTIHCYRDGSLGHGSARLLIRNVIIDIDFAPIKPYKKNLKVDNSLFFILEDKPFEDKTINEGIKYIAENLKTNN